MLLCGLSTAVVPLLPGSPWLEIAAGLFGLSIAANYSLVSAILVELISLERFVNAYGLLLLFQGVANLIGPPLAGWISDLTGKINLDGDVSLIIKQLYLKNIFRLNYRLVRFIILHCRYFYRSLGSYSSPFASLPAHQIAHVCRQRCRQSRDRNAG